MAQVLLQEKRSGMKCRCEGVSEDGSFQCITAYAYLAHAHEPLVGGAALSHSLDCTASLAGQTLFRSKEEMALMPLAKSLEPESGSGGWPQSAPR